MPTLLIVDDSPLECRLAEGLFRAAPDFALHFAEHGRDALVKIAIERPDVVVTDLVMPEMDGLEFVRAMRRRHPQIPVILMTAHGNEDVASEALREGAVSYVPKSLRAATLIPTVRQVLLRAQAVQRRQSVLKCMDHVDCSFVLENDPRLIPPLVDMVEETLAGMGLTDENGSVRVGIALEEGLLNALFHGNLGVESQAYREAKHTGRWELLTAERLNRPPYRDRRITFKMKIAGDEAQFVIRDEGAGCRSLSMHPLDAKPANFENGEYRGITLMRHLMDDVRFNDAGNEVKLFVGRRARPNGAAVS